jgi:hypothetical protein
VDEVRFSSNTIPFKPRTDTKLMALANACHVLVENNSLPGVSSIFHLRDGQVCDHQAQNNLT